MHNIFGIIYICVIQNKNYRNNKPAHGKIIKNSVKIRDCACVLSTKPTVKENFTIYLPQLTGPNCSMLFRCD